MIRILVLLTAAGIASTEVERPGGGAGDFPARGQGDPPGVVVVEMIDKSPTEFAFEPARITVQPGDTVRFVQKGAMPHNVEFKGAPGGAELDGVRMGPFLTRPDETWDLVVDDRFLPGEYPFVCTPHQFLGMTGLLRVEAASPASAGHRPRPTVPDAPPLSRENDR